MGLNNWIYGSKHSIYIYAYWTVHDFIHKVKAFEDKKKGHIQRTHNLFIYSFLLKG